MGSLCFGPEFLPCNRRMYNDSNYGILGGNSEQRFTAATQKLLLATQLRWTNYFKK